MSPLAQLLGHRLGIIMDLHNLSVIVPPQKSDAHHTHRSSIRHRRRKYLLVSNLLHWLHIVKCRLHFPGCEVLVPVDRARGDVEVVTTGEYLSEEGMGGGFVEIQDPDSCGD